MAKSGSLKGKQRISVEIGHLPKYDKRPALHNFLKYAGTPLSERATRGFLKRLNSGTLKSWKNLESVFLTIF